MRQEPLKQIYRALKFNKCDTQYQTENNLPDDSVLTERVKIEAFQGYSKAYNLSEYFRLRGLTSWRSGKQLTGLWKSDFPNVHYGDRKTQKGKSLMLFFRSKNHELLTIYTFQDGYYPSQQEINHLIKELM